MALDWDGRIRMDPSSSYAMQRLIGLRDRYDVAFACDTDHDRHGIVTRSAGLLPANHYLAVAIDYLFRNRPQWNNAASVGKTVVSTALIDRVAACFPEHPPYAGAISEVIPHVTVVESHEVALGDILAAANAALPFTAAAEGLELLAEGEDGRWHRRWSMPFSAGHGTG